jgi:hypothetical protein
MTMSVVPRRRAGLYQIRLIAGALLALSWFAIPAALPAHAQATDDTTNAAIPAPSPSIFPAATASSQTCGFGCNSQLQSCQNTCISTGAGNTVIPSITTVGTTTNPQACQSNCSAQQQACQRNCNLVGP